MLVCTNCQIEHEDGKKFCWNCGSPLVGKEESSLSPAPLIQPQEAKPQGILICPKCKWAYEWGKFCTKCGSSLGTEMPAQPEGEPPPSLLSGDMESPSDEEPPPEPFEIEVAPKRRLICPSCKLLYEGRETCIRCGSALIEHTPAPSQKSETPAVPEAPGVEKEEEVITRSPGPEEELPPLQLDEPRVVSPPRPPSAHRAETEEATEQGPIKRTTEGKGERKVLLPPKKKINFRRLSRETVSILILVIAGGYLLWAVYSHYIMKRPAESPPSKETSQPAATETSPISQTPVSPTPEPVPVQSLPTEAQEIEGINALLENIRKANLEKDIDLFMSCYASDFKGREEKRRSTLEAWKSYAYLDLSYDVAKQSVSGEAANARVEWVAKISSKKGGAHQESKTVLDVTLKKEETGWKIKEIKPLD